MGQLVTVREKASSNPEVVRFEINRSLTGMGHERYASLDDVTQDRPVDKVARTLLAHGGVAGVHVNSSVITVHLSGGSTGDGLREEIENLFRFYRDDAPVDGGEDPAVDADVADDTAAADAPAEETDGPADGGEPTEVTDTDTDTDTDTEAASDAADGSDVAADDDAEASGVTEAETAGDVAGGDDVTDADASEAAAAGEGDDA